MIYLYFVVGLCSSGPIARARFKIGGLSLKKINKRIFAWKEVQAGKKDSKNCQITSFDVHHWAGGEKNTEVFYLRFVNLYFLLKFCYKLIQQFKVTCFIAGQYNTGLLWHITGIILLCNGIITFDDVIEIFNKCTVWTYWTLQQIVDWNKWTGISGELSIESFNNCVIRSSNVK